MDTSDADSSPQRPLFALAGSGAMAKRDDSGSGLGVRGFATCLSVRTASSLRMEAYVLSTMCRAT